MTYEYTIAGGRLFSEPRIPKRDGTEAVMEFNVSKTDTYITLK
jgi:hypothetical protein